MVGNFTEDKTIKVKEETSDFDSNFGLEKAPAPKRHQNFLLNETEGMFSCLTLFVLHLINPLVFILAYRW